MTLYGLQGLRQAPAVRGGARIQRIHHRERLMDPNQTFTIMRGRAQHEGQSVQLRNYGLGAAILRDIGVGKMRVLSQPRKMPSMMGFGLEVTGYLGGEAHE